ncbi:translation initiation factor 3 subunit J, partial [Phenoliferia sp. Uapishka_3]
MSDWDASDNEEAAAPAAAPKAPALPIKKSKYADEDASDEDVKDDWDASDSDSEKKAAPKPTGPAPPVRAKGITKQKIAEKEAAEKARAAEIAARRDDDPQARKAREKAAMLKADMANAADLFGGMNVGEPDIFSMRCQSLPDFEEFSTLLADKILSTKGDHPLYAQFMLHFMKQLAAPISGDDVKKCGSALTTIANEKQKAAKDAASGKKKGKGAAKPGLGASKTVGSGRADTSLYEETLDDDYDDFVSFLFLLLT